MFLTFFVFLLVSVRFAYSLSYLVQDGSDNPVANELGIAIIESGLFQASDLRIAFTTSSLSRSCSSLMCGDHVNRFFVDSILCYH